LLKLKHKALEQTRTVSIPPETKSALRLKENAGKTTCKQLVAGDANKKYYFIVPTDMNSDDVFLSTQEANGDVHMFMTNSHLDLVNSLVGAKGKNLAPLPNPRFAQDEFNTVLQLWAQVAAGL
jgi:hypothetical protein